MRLRRRVFPGPSRQLRSDDSLTTTVTTVAPSAPAATAQNRLYPAWSGCCPLLAVGVRGSSPLAPPGKMRCSAGYADPFDDSFDDNCRCESSLTCANNRSWVRYQPMALCCGPVAGTPIEARQRHGMGGVSVLSDRASRAMTYVGLTRGRDENHLAIYPAVTNEADQHQPVPDEGIL
jgi:hypothetical protein